MLPTFAERFCQHYGVPVSAYRDEMMRRTLYPHARGLRPLLLLLDRQAHWLDEEFVNSVGRLNQLRDLAAKIEDFVWHPVNFKYSRQTLRLRVSVGRLRRQIALVMSGAADVSAADAVPQSSTAARRPA